MDLNNINHNYIVGFFKKNPHRTPHDTTLTNISHFMIRLDSHSASNTLGYYIGHIAGASNTNAIPSLWVATLNPKLKKFTKKAS